MLIIILLDHQILMIMKGENPTKHSMNDYILSSAAGLTNYPVCRIVHIKYTMLLNGNSST